MKKKEKIVIIDGHSLMNRAFYALPPLTNSSGQNTNAVYGFTSMLLKIINDENPDYIVAAFDRKAPTFRHVEYADYKAGRKKTPPELNEQFPIVKEVLKAFNVGIYEMDGYEADDIIGTISKSCEKDGMEVLIYTGDRDALQLVSKGIRVAITRKGISEVDLYDEEAMLEKYQVAPLQFIDIKGLMGDQSDNIPGVPGVGEKTAIKLIKEFGSVESVIENRDKISGKKLRELIDTYSEQALFSKKLSAIVTDAPVEFHKEDINFESLDRDRIVELFKELEFKSLINKLPSKLFEADKKNEYSMGQYKLAGSEEIKGFIEEVKSGRIMSMVFDIKGSDFYNTYIEGMGISWNGEESIYIPPDQKLLGMLKEVFEDEGIKKICHNAKDCYVSLYKHGINLCGVEFDTAIASYLLNPSESTYNVDELAGRFLNEKMPSLKEIEDIIKNSDEKDVRMNYLCQQSVYVYRLFGVLKKKLEENEMLKLYNDIEHPLIEVLASMEIQGFKADENILHELSKEFGDEIESLTKEIYHIAGEPFNINSPKQLGYVLFEKLGLPVIKKTKTGYSTDASVLEKLASQHEIVDKILKYRQIAKLKSTYVDGLLNIIKEDGKVHSSFNQTVTATGRISSTEPNLQNIPVKDDIGRRIRKAFVPSEEGYSILSADYSQIELRVLAHISGDKNLIDAFYNNLDIHSITASQVFNVPIEEVTPLMRSRAKAVNFGIVYGISDFGLASNLKISRKEAKTYIDNYFTKYGGVKKYMEDVIKHAKEKGYVTTLEGRRRYIPEITSSNFNIRSLGERLAMNTPIQGSAADIIKIAMVKVYRELKKRSLKSRLILQVHDELILEVYDGEVEEVTALVKENMEGALNLNVPLVVDVNIGRNWFEAK